MTKYGQVGKLADQRLLQHFVRRLKKEGLVQLTVAEQYSDTIINEYLKIDTTLLEEELQQLKTELVEMEVDIHGNSALA